MTYLATNTFTFYIGTTYLLRYLSYFLCRYNIVFFLVTYVIPLILMGACYARMGFHLWGTPIIGEETEALRKNYQNKKKVCI